MSNKFLIDKNKQRETFKKYIKYTLKDFGWFVKFSYVFEKILLVVAVILGLLNLINVIFFSHEPIFLLFLIITIGIPYGLSLIFKTVYREWILKDWKYRNNEKIQIDNKCIQYSYIPPFSNSENNYNVDISKIEKVEHNSCAGVITIKGDVLFTGVLPKVVMRIDEPGVDYYENQHLTSFSMLNIFQKDILDVFKENNVEISETSNVDIIKYKKW